MKRILLALTICVLVSNAFAQKYLELMQKEPVNFYEVQNEAERYFANRDKGKGSGYKHYKRWEYIHQKEIDDQGFVITAKQVWNEEQNFLQNWSNNQMQSKGNGAKSLTGNWTSLGPLDWNRTSGWNPGVGRIVCIDVDDNNQNLIYVGSPTGGLWKSTDGGANWTVLTDDFPVMDIWSVEIDPSNSNTVYMGTAGGGILKTTDGGLTWNQTGTISGTIRDILIHPTNSNIVFAARTSSSNGAIFRSTNGGTTWTQVSSVNTEDLRFKPGDPSIVYACGNDFQRSIDGGLSWTTISSGITHSERMKMDVSPANPNYVYLIQKSGNRFGRVYRSTNSGVSFTIRSQYDGSTNNYLGYNSDGTDDGGQAGRDMAITVSNTNANEIIIAGIILFKSTDGGVNYIPLTEWFLPNSLGYVHADVEVLDYVGSNLFIGSDGGIYKSTDNGSNFTDLTTGLGIRQFYRIGCSQSDPNVVSGGSQDNGTSVMRGPTRDWVDWLGADGMETFIDYSNANLLFGTSQYGSMYKSTNQGNSRSNISKPSGVGNGNWVTPFEIDPQTSTTIYVGFDELYKSTNSGNTWNAISTFGGGNMNEIALAPSNSNVIYVSFGTQLFTTTNGGTSWNSITEPWTGFINYISVDPNNPQRVAVAVSGSQKAFISTDGGSNWTNITLNLPGIGANCILLDSKTENGIYMAMQSGVYYKDDLLPNWIPFLTGLPKVRVEELEIVNSVGKIRAGTYGRGLWESDVYSGNSGSLPPVADFSANITTALVGQSIGFLDNSLGSPTSWLWTFPGGTPSSSTVQNPIVSYSTAGTYSVSLTATNANGSDAITKPGFITITNYCIPDFTSGTSDGDFIDGVVLGTINNTNTGGIGGPSYNDYTNLSTNLALNSNQILNITSGSYFSDHYAAWIDFNQDNDFDDPGEKLGEILSNTSFQGLSIAFTVPNGAQLGSTTLRIRCVYNGANMNPCTGYNWGETEDYSVVITSAATCTPTFSVGTGDGDFIDGVQFGSLSNLNTGNTNGASYNDYTNLNCEVNKIGTYNLTITSGAYFTDVFAAWIDWNGDGSFDNQEKIGEFTTTSAFESNSLPVEIPISLDTGNYLMRVRCAYNATNMSPCSQYTWGETEDYMIRVLPSTDVCVIPTPPIAANDSVCGDGVLNLGVSGTANFFNWYQNATAQTAFHQGNTYTTSLLTSSETYYVAAGAEESGHSLTTFYAGGNGANGNHFDVTAAKKIRIDGFDVNLNSTSSQIIEVYYKQGTYEGFELQSTAWTLLGIDTVIAQGLNNPTYVDIGGLVIEAEETFGFAIFTAQGNLRYTNLPSDSLIIGNDIYLKVGKGIGNLFGNIFGPRAFNGSVHYTKYAECFSGRTQVTAKVNPLPQVQFNAIGDLCENASVTNLSSSPNGGIFSGNGVITNQFDPQIAGIGNHLLIYTYTNASACSNSDSINVIVRANPTVSLTLQDSICENESPIVLTGGMPNGGIYSGIGVSSGIFDPSIGGSGLQQISYSYTDTFGCSNSTLKAISVLSKPNVSFNSNLSFCEGENPITISGAFPTGGNFIGSGITGNIFDPSIAGIGLHQISYTYQSANACSDTASSQFTVHALPNVVFSTLNDICIDAGLQTLNTATPAGGVYSGIGVSGNTFDPAISGAGSFVLKYEFTDINTCTNSDSILISVFDLPTVSLAPLPSICENQDSLILIFGNPSGGNYSGMGVANGQFDPSVTGVGTFQISYSYQDTNFCSNLASGNITVKQVPISDFGYDAQTLMVSFFDSSINATAYSWKFGDGDSSIQQNPVHNYLSPGPYNVCLTAMNDGCMDEYCEAIAVISNLSKSISNENIRFYPNPFNSELNYEIASTKDQKVLIDLLDIKGNVLERFNIALNPGINKGILKVKNLASGTYLLRIQDNESFRTVKVERGN